MLEWMGLNFYDYDGLQPKITPPNISADSVLLPNLGIEIFFDIQVKTPQHKNLCTQKQKHLKCRTRPLHPLSATVPTAARPLRRSSRGPHVLQREADLFLLRVEVIAPLPSTIVAYGGLR